MERVTVPYDGSLLVSHLVAYGTAVALDAADVDAFVSHDPESQSFEPCVAFEGDRETLAAAVRATAAATERIVEQDIEPGKRGNDRRSVIWARLSIDRESERLAQITAARGALLAELEASRNRVALGLLAGIGAPVTWGPDHLKTSAGATALDGVLGNHTSDFVRGVLRPMRKAAAALDGDPFDPALVADAPHDKTGWSPPATSIAQVHQWLAALGLSLLPVAHRSTERSQTPACWALRDGPGRPWRRGVTLPLLDAPTSLPRLRALLSLAQLGAITRPGPDGRAEPEVAGAAGALRSLGVTEVVAFPRREKDGGGSALSFTFGRGERVAL